ncbi:bifunctional folylpolyglutamate synthase/dihydrofolate synthase [Actinomyces vulturis]|uniref:bifunctional folylpolyglutamate synthase/dihydrofolate synthase n=1 Tax=Actinomyces vulturis TaxID=1857645 RepID=UPI00082A064D|nr:folylpolyglutamate synthase/dihydrofolate synthase family protein [Actinomyces vulturis]
MTTEHTAHSHPEPPKQHSGAAFGIPEGASEEEVVDAVFGVDESLLPYLEAADSDDLSLAEVREAGMNAQERAKQADDEDREALRALIAGQLLGDDEQQRMEALDALLSDIDTDDWQDWDNDDDEDDSSAAQSHEALLRQAAREVDTRARMRAIEQEILSRAPEHKVQPSLERIEAFLDLVAHPEQTYRVVHVTGTNGKTSTTRMVESLLRATGMRTGRFTSPHLSTIRERIALDGEPISEEAFIAAWEDVAPYIAMVDEQSLANGGVRMSFFEILTCMALATFADYPVDVAIIEVGMGGRWDATNVVPGDVEVITPIGLDHSMWLGETIEEIATEKAGIIKPASSVVVSSQRPEAWAPILAAVEETGALLRAEVATDAERTSDDEWFSSASVTRPEGELQVLDRQLAVGGQLVTLKTAAAVYEDIFLPLHGEHQAHNALLALAACEALFAGRPIPGQVVENGFSSVTSPGRMEVLRSSPTVVVDAAHNPHGIEALRAGMEEVFHFSHLVAVVGAMADKDVEGIFAGLEPMCQSVVCVPIDSPRAMDVDELATVAREVFGSDRVDCAESLLDGIEKAAAAAENHDDPLPSSGVLVVGSVVLAAQARQLFGKA